MLSANQAVPGGTRMVLFDVTPEGDLTLQEEHADGFYSREWSPDGTRISGSKISDTGEWAAAFYDRQSKHVTVLQSEVTGQPVLGISYHPWLDERRMFMYDADARRLRIADVTTGLARPVNREFEQVATAIPFPNGGGSPPSAGQRIGDDVVDRPAGRLGLIPSATSAPHR